MKTFDCTASETREIGVQEALNAVQRGELVVLPTDTVYGVGADAFSPQAVTALLAAKGRGRDMPVPVLIGAWRTARALTDHLSDAAELLIGAFWPGALTVIVTQGSGLAWDLGDSNGTVALRMPLHDVAIDLLQATGPLAVSSANRTGSPAPTTADEAQAQLGDTVAVYLDGGPTPGATPSTIVDVTGAQPRLVREGAITRAQLEEAVGVVGIA
jgi:tRNA threonylcarbamoyl adenosine modification protein (Sua5/YciO/YrdC/YwlC family)